MGAKPWTDAMINELISRYQNETANSIAKHLGKTKDSVEGKAKNLGLYKGRKSWNTEQSNELARRYPHETNEAIALSTGRTANAVRGRAIRMKLRKTKEFIYNSRSGMSIGTEVIEGGYLFIKITNFGGKSDWRQKHLLIWEEKNGPVPPDHIVLFIDGNKSNIEINNLECISRADNLKRNSANRFPMDLLKVIHLKSELTRKINRLIKGEKNGK